MKPKNIICLLAELVLFCSSCSEIPKEIPQTNINTVNAAKYLIGEQESVLAAKDFLSKSYHLTKSSQKDLKSNVQAIYRSIQTNTNQSVSTKSSIGYESIPVYIINFLKEIISTTDKKCNMDLTWDQRPSPYNDSLPPCTTDKMPAGCVAIAIAQIMAYYEKPSAGSYTHPVNRSKIATSYNWNGMKSAPKATSVSTQFRPMIANLLAEIGNKTDMQYACNGSGSYLSNAKNCFVSMGYKEPTIASYQFENIMREIDTKNPVYMRGSNPEGGGGHAWVIEGYKSNYWEELMIRECPNNATERTPTGINGSNDYLYFNLGWGGLSNGYYLAEAFSIKASGKYKYTYNIQTITNIRPN